MRKYSSTIPAMTLGAQLSAGATSITLNTGAWPTVTNPDTLTLVIEPDTANEEIVYVTAHTAASTSATILRAQESTTDITHASGSVVKHMITGADLQEAHTHMNATNYSTNNNVALHGIGTGEGAVVGTDKTQTLKNKTINVGGADNNTISGLTISNVSGIAGTYAPLASPAFTGTPTIGGTAIATTATAPASHTHGNLTNDGKIGASSGNVIVTGASGVLTALAAGSAGQFLSYNGTWATPSGATAGVSSLAGTANQISASASTGAVTLSFPTGGVTVPTGSLVATTPTTGDNTTKIATTAFVQTAVAGVSGGSTPLWYRRTTDATAVNSTTSQVMFATSPSLDASSWYYFKFFAFITYSFTSGSQDLRFELACSSAPTSVRATVLGLSSGSVQDALQITSTSATTVSGAPSATGDHAYLVEGFLNTNLATTFTPRYSLSNTGATATVITGSHIQIEKLSTSAANINGTWT